MISFDIDVKIELYVGKTFNIDTLGEVVILDIEKDYLVLAVLDKNKFVVCNSYWIDVSGLCWLNGNYYSSFKDLVKGLKNK